MPSWVPKESSWLYFLGIIPKALPFFKQISNPFAVSRPSSIHLSKTKIFYPWAGKENFLHFPIFFLTLDGQKILDQCQYQLRTNPSPNPTTSNDKVRGGVGALLLRYWHRSQIFTWLWWWLPIGLSKCHSPPPTRVPLGATFTRSIRIPDRLLLLGWNTLLWIRV